MVDKQQILGTMAEFTWSFGKTWFVETQFGNFIWSDPDYAGDNTFKKFDGDYRKWCDLENIDAGRSKGFHNVERYCGNQIIFEQ